MIDAERLVVWVLISAALQALDSLPLSPLVADSPSRGQLIRFLLDVEIQVLGAADGD